MKFYLPSISLKATVGSLGRRVRNGLPLIWLAKVVQDNGAGFSAQRLIAGFTDGQERLRSSWRARGRGGRAKGERERDG
jgi:hypothetical protein